METLAFFANLGSLVGLAATLWTAWRAYRSKRYYQLVGRVPEGIERVQKHSTNLFAASDEHEQRIALGQVRVGVESIARNIGRNERGDFDRLARRIRQLEQQDALDTDAVRHVYREADTLTSQAESIVTDRKFLQSS